MKRRSHLFAISLLCMLNMFACKPTIQILPTKKPTNIGIKIAFRKGTIFTENYSAENLGKNNFDISKRFTHIEQMLSIMWQQVIEVGKLHVGSYPGYPWDMNMNGYFTQYFGFINASGEKVIHLNYLWNKGPNKVTYESEYMTVSNGGKLYWQLEINLTTGKVIDLRVNPE
nr:hypothetical protein [uncultured Mucilaginibacter sp.]